MHTLSFIRRPLAIFAFASLIACSPKPDGPLAEPDGGSAIDDVEQQHTENIESASGDDEADGPVEAESANPKPATETEPSREPAVGSEQVDNNAEDAGAPNAGTIPTDSSDDERQEPEYGSGSFGVSDDSGELEMLLGLREIPPFRIDDLLTKEDLKEALGMRAPTERGPLAGSTPSPYYNHLRFLAKDPEQLGVTLQYWHFNSTPAATVHFQLLANTAASEAKPVGLASESFFTTFEGVTQLVSVDYELHAVLAIACQTDGCHVPQLMQWMRNAIQRLNE